jgi:hypothetical protein
MNIAAGGSNAWGNDENWQAKPPSDLGRLNFGAITSRRAARPRIVVEHTIGRELVCVVATGMEQANRDAIRAVDAAGAVYIHPIP